MPRQNFAIKILTKYLKREQLGMAAKDTLSTQRVKELEAAIQKLNQKDS